MTPTETTPDQIGERDHHETAEYRIFGPPGCGKTTSLTRQISRAAARFGTGSILVTSFTRAAAAELGGRDLPIPHDRIGTLHSHCWRALGGPPLAEANVEQWNIDHEEWAITPAHKQEKLAGEDVVDDAAAEHKGDYLLQEVSRYRGAQWPFEYWKQEVKAFAEAWKSYKDEYGLMDFTDLIEYCWRDVDVAPNNPRVLFVDEAQDLNRMQLALIRKWGKYTDYFILAGDDDQTIYGFTGASPEAFLTELPDDHKILLKQSYRVPRAVHGFAEALIRRVKFRQAKEYYPRAPYPGEDPVGGLVQIVRGHYRMPEHALLAAIEQQLKLGKKIMLLGACSYMLSPFTTMFRKEGIPFHNPYRKANGAWNPLRLGSQGSTASRVVSLAIGHPGYGVGHRLWSKLDVAHWMEVMKAEGFFQRGKKGQLARAAKPEAASLEFISEFLVDDAWRSLAEAWQGDIAGLIHWWHERLVKEVQKRAEFPVNIALKRGARVLTETPQITVGTIHSVKGGQADVVFLLPDLSLVAASSYATEDDQTIDPMTRTAGGRDAIIRQFYVGATRARERLFLARPAKPHQQAAVLFSTAEQLGIN